MSTVQEIQHAIRSLPDADRQMLFDWIEEQEELAWDQQIGRDFDANKLEALMSRARNEAKQGQLRPSP